MKSYITRTAIRLSALLFAAASAAPAPAQTSSAGVLREGAVLARELAGGLRHPWALAFLPGGDLLVTERPGNLLRLAPDGSGGYRRTRVSGVPPVRDAGQGGLLDVAVAPDFDRSSRVYLTYAKAGPGGAGTALGAARLEGSGLEDFRVLWELERRTPANVHYGSRVAVGPDGLIYFNVSDRGEMARAQDPRDPAGSVLRLRPDGSPAGTGAPGWRPELLSIGHRNIQGLAFDGSGRLWATEHGPRGGDELNLVEAGKNYGWPTVTRGIGYDGAAIGESGPRPGMEEPKTSWTPSIAPSGLAWYPPVGPFADWAGNLLSGNLAGQELRRIVLEGDRVAAEESLFKGKLGRIRDVRVGPDGLVYLLTDAPDGKLFRLEPAREP